MARLVSLVALMLAITILINEVSMCQAATSAQPYNARHLLSIDCPSACEMRCSKSSRKKICEPDCVACCHSCGCVPSGTAGNREECQCYATLLNSKKTGKCP